MPSLLLSPVPKKRALLIGIEVYEDEELERLDCPHHDIIELQQVLLDIYRYGQKDIVAMWDGIGNADLEPTKENILREAKNLVEDAQPGDHFLFYYAGHSLQQPTSSISEEDRQDEYIVPVDAKGHTNLIRDNDLRALLVNVLPVGSTLVAIIDSCHSESMLDLDHFRCNRVYTPWVSKGGRKSDPKRNVVVRHNDIVVSMTDAWASSQSIARSPVTRHATHDLVPWMFRQRVASKSVKLVPLTPLQIRYSSPASPIPFTESPAALYCTGFCDRTLADTNKTAYVVCISACKDRQRAWENGRNWESLSMAMINILRECPTPTLRDLMSKLNHRTYDLSLQLHNEARKWRAANRPAGLTLSDEDREANPLEMDNFQDPQLASHSPLDMDAIFTL